MSYRLWSSVAVLAFSILLPGFQEDSRGTFTIPKFKDYLRKNQPIESLTFKTFLITGYFVAERKPMLITDPSLMRMNTPMADSQYLVLRGKGIDSLPQFSDYEGKRVTVQLAIVDKHLFVIRRPLILADQ